MKSMKAKFLGTIFIVFELFFTVHGMEPAPVINTHQQSYATTIRIPPSCQNALHEIFSNYFSEVSINDIDIALLPGGHSNTCLLITVQGKKYVVRIKKEQQSSKDLKRELYVMQEAASLSIAPQIFYVTRDNCAVVMEYIAADTLSLEQSRRPDNIKNIAHALRKTHAIAQNPYFEKTGIEIAIDVYHLIKDNRTIEKELAQALALMRLHSTQLAAMNTNKVNVHGDLNPRNIFLCDNQAIFIDWEYTDWEDPFIDLSYLALRLDYSTQEEMFFLESYLQHPPSPTDIERYYRAKKLNYAELTIFFFYFSLKYTNDLGSLDSTTPLKDWSYYVKVFVDGKQDDVLSMAQFYYDLARHCLKKAQ